MYDSCASKPKTYGKLGKRAGTGRGRQGDKTGIPAEAGAVRFSENGDCEKWEYGKANRATDA